MEKTGKLSIHTDNIFKIIKKFLYEDREVFLRELVANAVDATQKLKTLAEKGEIKEDLGDLTIEVKLNKDKGTIHIIDKGIGMTQEEVEKYINQVAFSSAKEFIEKYQEADGKIIGFFGLGFYSAFLVAKKVEIITRSYKEPEDKAVHWECEGNPEFKMKLTTKKERGTEVIIHLADDASEFNSEYRIAEILNKYCKFLPIPIKFQDKIINDKEPIWLKNPQELSEKDYKEFYKVLFPNNEDPIFWIHLNIDYPFILKGILYFPKLKPYLDPEQNKIALYVNRVFITDDLRGILPEYLNLLHGVIDSPDIPLNVSRSALQLDANIRKIQNYISKKVADALKELFKKDRKHYEKIWKNIEIFVKYAAARDIKLFERVKDIILIKDIEGKYYTIEELKNETKDKQTDKNGTLIWLYSTNKQEQYPFIKEAIKKGYKVLLFDNIIDTHFIGFLESQLKDVQFRRIDSDTISKLIDKGEEVPPALSPEKQQELIKIIKEALPDVPYSIEIDSSASGNEIPMKLVISEYDRRLQEMMKGFIDDTSAIPKHYKIIVNANHPVWTKILLKPDNEKIKYMYNLARLPHKLLSGEEFSEFIEKSYDIISKN